MHLSLVTVFLLMRLGAILLEIVLGAAGLVRAHYEWRDTLASLSMRAGNVVVNLAMTGIMVGGLALAYRYRVATMEPTSVLAWVVLFFLDDFTYYVFHRISHESRFWWAAHVNHHSSRLYNLSTAARQSWTGVVVGTWMPWIPLAFLGYSPTMILTMQGFNLFYQFWLHTEAVRRLPAWFEYLFNTPSHHRVHHASNPRYLDRNYAGVLMVWDRWFGTFEAERDDDPPVYGILNNIRTFNPIRIALHEWWALGRDLIRARSLREVLGGVFGPPGWRADGSGLTTAAVRSEWVRRSTVTGATVSGGGAA
jgi:sterol desaturase/sphingolipid hydroxylase (fatty acid hydroxylase superfamily)